MKFYGGEKAAWTFRKERHKTPSYGLRLFLCGGEGEYAGYGECALVPGKLYSLFGEPAFNADYDSTYVCETVAETPERAAYLTIDEHGSTAAVLYSEDTKEAAYALAEMINAAKPADFEYGYK